LIIELESQYTSTRVSIPGSSAWHPKEGIDGCGRGVRTSIGTLASTKAYSPYAVGKRTARPVTTDRTFRQYFSSCNFNVIRKT